MKLNHDDLLISHVEFGSSTTHQINLHLLSTRTRNALKRALLASTDWQKRNEGFDSVKNLCSISLQDISCLTISDIRDLKHVGESTLIELIRELQSTLNIVSQEREVPKIETRPLPEKIRSEIVTLEMLRVEITLAPNIESLIELMISYQKVVTTISEREEFIWRERLPWITDLPQTLGSLGIELGLTRERVRQIQQKSSRYPYEIFSPIFVLSEIQNLLLECQNHDEFRIAMIDEELTLTSSISLGRVRFLAVELRQFEVVSEIERTIYAWSQG